MRTGWDLTGDSFVIEMAILLSKVCWAGERKQGKTGQLQSIFFLSLHSMGYLKNNGYWY